MVWECRLLYLLSGLAFLIGVSLAGGGLLTRSWVLLLGGAIAVFVGAMLLVAAHLFRTGKERNGAIFMAVALVAAAGSYMTISPGGTAFIALLPVIVVAVILPFVRMRTLMWVLAASWTTGAALVALNIYLIPTVTLSPWLDLVFRAVGYAAILALTLSMLIHHHRRMIINLTNARQDAERLRQAHEELKESDKTKTRFLNAAAHELRTPLTPVLIQLQILRDHPAVAEDPRLGQSTRVIDRNLHRLKAHVDELLEIARLQSGRSALRVQALVLDRLLQDAEESFRPVAADRGIRFDLSSTPGISLEADPERLMEVVFNLLSNAVKATPAGGRIVLFSETDGETCSIHVTDTGRGIEKEDQKRLFQPFERLSGNGHEKDGVGLGLFLSRNIVEAHHGEISCESPGPGKGSTFTVRLPLEQPETHDQPVQVESGGKTPSSMGPRGSPAPGERPPGPPRPATQTP